MKQSVFIVTHGFVPHANPHINAIAVYLAQRGYHVSITLPKSEFGHTQTPAVNHLYFDPNQPHTIEQIFRDTPYTSILYFLGDYSPSVNRFDQYQSLASLTYFLRVASNFGVKNMICILPSLIYGNPAIVPVTEEYPKQPVSSAGKQAHIAQILVQDLLEDTQMQYLFLCHAQLIGSAEYCDPISKLLYAAHTNIPCVLTMPAGATVHSKIYDLLHYNDLAYACLRALKHLKYGGPSDFFNVGTGRFYSLAQLTQVVELVTGKKIILCLQEESLADEAGNKILSGYYPLVDPTKAMNILGWQPRYADLYLMARALHARMLKAGFAYLPPDQLRKNL